MVQIFKMPYYVLLEHGWHYTEFRKILSKYLGHEQNSVFYGDIKMSTLKKLREELNNLINNEDKIFELSTENRNNVNIDILKKFNNNIIGKINDDLHKKDYMIL